LHISPTRRGRLINLERGYLEVGESYHQVFTDERYVYDPLLSPEPVPKGDWESMMKRLNLGRVRIFSVPAGTVPRSDY